MSRRAPLAALFEPASEVSDDETGTGPAQAPQEVAHAKERPARRMASRDLEVLLRIDGQAAHLDLVHGGRPDQVTERVRLSCLVRHRREGQEVQRSVDAFALRQPDGTYLVHDTTVPPSGTIYLVAVRDRLGRRATPAMVATVS